MVCGGCAVQTTPADRVRELPLQPGRYCPWLAAFLPDAIQRGLPRQKACSQASGYILRGKMRAWRDTHFEGKLTVFSRQEPLSLSILLRLS